jgi:hypothetical protein
VIFVGAQQVPLLMLFLTSFFSEQVPVVSDRLLISIISVDTGKTIARSSKAAARNGICQWPDSILESIWFSQDEASKEFEDCQCRITVSMVHCCC